MDRPGSIAFALCCAPLLLAAGSAPYSVDMAGWTVSKTWENCDVEGAYRGPGNTTLTVHYGKSDDTTFIILYNANWSPEDRKFYKLRYAFDERYYDAPSMGYIGSDRQGIGTIASDKFLEDLAQSNILSVEFAETEALISNLKLKGSGAALAKFKQCRSELRAHAEREKAEAERLKDIPVDPFAGDSRPEA